MYSFLTGWRGQPGTARVSLRADGATEWADHSLAADPLDPTLYSGRIPLLPDTAYTRTATFTTPCGLTLPIVPAAAPRTFQTVPAVTFTERAYAFAIPDDYDVTTTVTGAPHTHR